MKEKYSSPVVVSADAVEGNVGAFPAAILAVMADAAVAATTAYASAKVVKSVFKASPTLGFKSLTERWRNENDFCLA